MNRKLHLICAVLAAAPLAWPTAAVFAQSVQDFRLKPGEPTNAPRPQGPVDEDIQIRQPRPTPEPEPEPTAQPQAAPPIITLPPPRATASPAPRPTATPANRATPAPTEAALPQATASADVPAPEPTASEPSTPVPVPQSADVSEATAPPVRDLTTPIEPESPIPFWTWLVGAALLVGAAGWFFIRRKQAELPVRAELAPRPSAPPSPIPVPAPEPAPTPEPAAKAAPAPVPAAQSQQPVPSSTGITLELMPKSLSASLFMATLSYRIAIHNDGIESLGTIAIAGDMIAAHASASTAEQLAAIGKDLPEIHRIEGLRPGERIELTGDIRLPLSAITPIRKGNAALFVPLVRFYALDPAAGVVISGSTFVVGEPPQAPGGRIRPFRLDLGPRVYPTVEQRKLALPDAMPLDGRALAG